MLVLERVKIGCGVGFAAVCLRVFSRIINTVRQSVGALADRLFMRRSKNLSVGASPN